eukprot:gene13381-17943_t
MNIFLFISLLISVDVTVKCEWFKSPVPNSYVDIIGVKWLSSSSCITVGSQVSSTYSEIYSSNNSGRNWSIALSKTELSGVRLMAVASFGEGLSIVAYTGQIYYSSNSGKTWTIGSTISSSSYSLQLRSISIGSNGMAFVVGGKYTSKKIKNVGIFNSSYKSNYSFWSNYQLASAVAKQLYRVSTYNGICAITVGESGTILNTIDGGVSWTFISQSSCPTSDLYGVSFYSSNLSIITGTDGCVMKSLDSGFSWSKVNSGYFSSSGIFYDISIAKYNLMFMVGSNGLILKSVDDGNAWTIDYNSSSLSFQSLDSLVDGNVIVGSELGGSEGSFFLIHDSFPTFIPTLFPTVKPTRHPTEPSSHPTFTPSLTSIPTNQPSSQPSLYPTSHPSDAPSTYPTQNPSKMPTSKPCNIPSVTPTITPSVKPTHPPNVTPTAQPTSSPTMLPVVQPTMQPTTIPTMQTSGQPTNQPIPFPWIPPSSNPSTQPSKNPTYSPYRSPTVQPSNQPSFSPSNTATLNPTATPTFQPKNTPSYQPNAAPSLTPTESPTVNPSFSPLTKPSIIPTNQPIAYPSCLPSSLPSFQPSALPTSQPSLMPSRQTIGDPSASPTSQPSSTPSSQPTDDPSSFPSYQLTLLPSSVPTRSPIALYRRFFTISGFFIVKNMTQDYLPSDIQHLFRKCIAETLLGTVRFANIHIISISQINSLNGRKLYLKLIAPRFKNQDQTVRYMLQIHWNITFVPSEVGYPTENAAYVSLTSKIKQSLSDGTFGWLLERFGSNGTFNHTSLLVEFNTIYSPTLIPTNSPSVTSTKNHSSNTSPVHYAIIFGSLCCGLFLLTVLSLCVYYIKSACYETENKYNYSKQISVDANGLKVFNSDRMKRKNKLNDDAQVSSLAFNILNSPSNERLSSTNLTVSKPPTLQSLKLNMKAATKAKHFTQNPMPNKRFAFACDNSSSVSKVDDRIQML